MTTTTNSGTNAAQDSSPASIAATAQRLQGGPARHMAELMQGSAQDSSAPVPADERALFDDVIAAAQDVVQDAIDGRRSEVHPCDRDDNDLAVRACSSEIQVLHAALKSAAHQAALALQAYSESDIPADAPRAFAKRYSALVAENMKLKAALADTAHQAAPAQPSAAPPAAIDQPKQEGQQ